MTKIRLYSIAIAILMLGLVEPASAAKKNGFDLNDALIPSREIRHGGPPRDGIPAIDHPTFVRALQAKNLKPDDRILGYADAHSARAYPVNILNWHEIVNDTASGSGLLVTFCPLCGTGMAFRVERGKTFGVSGLLYNSDMLLYDRESESLWSQIDHQAISGPRKGEILKTVVLRHTDWASWLRNHPDTYVLAPPTRRNYRISPYGRYDKSRRLLFPVNARSKAFHPKSRVIGIVIDGQARAWPFEELAKLNHSLKENFASGNIEVFYDSENDSAWIHRSGAEIPSSTAFWFAWYAFHPDTSVFTQK